jgi:hypothetical protein
MAMRNDEEKQIFAWRGAAWTAQHEGARAAAIRTYATAKGSGQPPAAKVYLRDLAGDVEIIAQAALSALLIGVVQRKALTALATNAARAVAQATGAEPADNRQAVQIGYVLVGLICDTTQACEIVGRHGERPQKVAGGVKVSPSYELVVTRGQFLADAAAFGSMGMPTFSKAAPAPWTSQKSGGIEGQQGGMVHGAGKVMEGVSHNTAPALFEAVNGAAAARFRLNPVTADLVTNYDDGAAYDWLLTHYLAQGMDPAKAAAAAKEAARL